MLETVYYAPKSVFSIKVVRLESVLSLGCQPS